MELNKRQIGLSRFLSYVLRHRPEEIGIALDEQGWIDVDALIAACANRKRPITRKELAHVVEHSDKRRFAFDETGTRIRASQGHSIDVELGYAAAVPPELLFHGTAQRFVEAILREGIDRRARHHVHLSLDAATAREVGSRHGRPAVLEVRAGAMAREGLDFFLAENDVWLTEHVPRPTFVCSTNGFEDRNGND